MVVGAWSHAFHHWRHTLFRVPSRSCGSHEEVYTDCPEFGLEGLVRNVGYVLLILESWDSEQEGGGVVVAMSAISIGMFERLVDSEGVISSLLSRCLDVVLGTRGRDVQNSA
jgi:hypothetical protein